MSEPVTNWEALVHKNARSADGVDIGNITEVDDRNLIIIQGVVKEKEYRIPHSAVEEFNGAEVRLNIRRGDAKLPREIVAVYLWKIQIP